MSNLTVFELDEEHQYLARPLYADATFDRVHVEAVFQGIQPGRIFVDDPVAPTSAMLCRTYEFYLAGEVAPSLFRFIADAPAEAGVFETIHDLAAARLQQTTAFYGLVPLNSSWRGEMKRLYDSQLEIIGRRAFRFDPDKADHARRWPERVPEGFSIHPVDAALARKIDEEAGELIGLFWGGYERYGQHGFGSCAMYGDEISGVTYTIAVSDKEANLGVETVERFRRKGLATLMSEACVVQALDRGLTPTWDCDLPNAASAALALKVGFDEFPSFTEHAFPERRGPVLTAGTWVSEAVDIGSQWRQVSG